jgi:hypothetical protein
MTKHRIDRNKSCRAPGWTIRVLGLALLCLLIAHRSVRAAILTNGGFEDAVSTAGGVPLSQGVWQGDYSQITFAARGVQPFDGSGMLRFLATRPLPPGRESTGCEVYQLVDLTAYRELISAGFAAIRLSAQFNRVPGDEQTDDRFGLSLFVLDTPTGVADPSTLPRLRSVILVDADPATWESHSLTWTLPPSAVAIYAMVEASENRFNDLLTSEFDGHYADAVALDVFPAIPGDTNADGRVDIADLANVRNNFGMVGDLGLPGDAYPPDGRVSVNDLNLVRGNYGKSISFPVPEPATLSVGLLLLAATFKPLRRHIFNAQLSG